MNTSTSGNQGNGQAVYSFTLGEMKGVEFPVIAFECAEELSTLYTLRVATLSEHGVMDEALALQSKATLRLQTPEGERRFHGIVSEMHVEAAYPTHCVHVLEIRPPHWLLTQSFATRVYRDLDVEGILRAVLSRHFSENSDFRIDLTRKYRKREYICQYEETDFDFLCRWMESQGLCFLFEHGTDGVCMVVTDANTSHPAMEPPSLSHRPGNDADHYRRIGTPDDLLLTHLRNRMARSPGKVVVRDYNYERPTLDLTREAFTNPQSGDKQAAKEGETFIYGGGQAFPEEAENQAKLRAEMLACRRIRFEGTSNAYPMAAGLTVTVQDHPAEAFNQAYLLVSVRHEGAQAHLYAADIPDLLSEYEDTPLYRNTFAAIPDAVQFRPERNTPWPVVRGMLNAFVDGEAESEYAQLDDVGRYKVRLPFDEADSEKGDGKASHWLRMSSPYGGENFGFNFPLHKGTEVVLSFENGDPDRPFIVGMMQNPQAPGVLKGGTQRRAGLQSAGGNVLGISDVKGHEYFQMGAAGGSTLMLGDDGGGRAEITADNVSGSANQALYYAGLGWTSMFGLLFNELSAGGMYLTPIITNLAKEALKGNKDFYKNRNEKNKADKWIDKKIRKRQSPEFWKGEHYSEADAKVKAEQAKAKFIAETKAELLKTCAPSCTQKAAPCLSVHQMDACDWARRQLKDAVDKEAKKEGSALNPSHWQTQTYSDEDAAVKAKQHSKDDTAWPVPIPELSIPVEQTIDAALKSAVKLVVKQLQLAYETQRNKGRVKDGTWKKALKEDAKNIILENPILGSLLLTGLNAQSAYQGKWDEEPGVVISRDSLTSESKVTLLRGGNSILINTNAGAVNLSAPAVGLHATPPLFNPPVPDRMDGFVTLTYDAKGVTYSNEGGNVGTFLAASADKFDLRTNESILSSEKYIGIKSPKIAFAVNDANTPNKFCSQTCDAQDGVKFLMNQAPFQIESQSPVLASDIWAKHGTILLQSYIRKTTPYGKIEDGEGGMYNRAGLKLTQIRATMAADNIDLRTNNHTLLADKGIQVQAGKYELLAKGECNLHAKKDFKISSGNNHINIGGALVKNGSIVNLGADTQIAPKVDLKRSKIEDWKPA